VIHWLKEVNGGIILIGGNRQGNQFNLSFDQQNNLSVVDSLNNRVQKFEIN
jgi:hypothetical protein